MHYTKIAAVEAKLKANGLNGAYTLKPFGVDMPGEPGRRLEGLGIEPVSRTGYYYTGEHAKKRVIVHYTAGNIQGDLGALTQQDYHVSVPFLIARDGTIYQLYSSRFWSGNIGATPLNPDNREDKATIAIELSNYGPLKLVGDNLETIYSRRKDDKGRISPVDVYCTLAETEAYIRLAAPYRDFTYFATHTPAQYASLIQLLRYLTARYNIPRVLMPVQKRFIYTPDVLNFAGIVSHVNYRSSGKTDIGPAFDWAKVEAGLV